MRQYLHPSAEEFTLERILYALSDPLRLEIVLQLNRVTEASCSDLDRGRPKSSVSHHFRVLRESGLVRTRCVGTTHMNSLRHEELEMRFPGLLQAILAHCPQQAGS